MYLGASRTCRLYVFDSDMDAHVNRRCVMDGLDREIVVKIRQVLNLVEMFLRAGEFIRNQEVFKVRLGSPHGELDWLLEVQYQDDATSHNYNRISCRILPHTNFESRPVGTHCSIVLQDCFFAEFTRNYLSACA